MRKISDELMPLSEACRRMNITRQALYVAIKGEKLEAKKIGKCFYVTQNALNKYRNNRYNRELRKKNGEYIFDATKGNLSVDQASKLLSVMLGEECNAQKVYYLVRTGAIRAFRVGATWVVDKNSAMKFAQDQKILVSIYDDRQRSLGGFS